MLRRLTPIVALIAFASIASAQEANYSEDRVAPSRVPPSFLKAAEKEAPGVRLSTVYKDNEKGYRFVGKAADGRTFSVRIDRDGKLSYRRTYTDLLPAKLPKAVSKAFQDEVARNAKLAGFRPARTSLVERFDALKNETSTYYEAFGHTPANLHPRIEVDVSGKILLVDTDFIPSTGDYTKHEPLAAKDVPPEIRQGVVSAAPGIKIASIFRVTNKGATDVTYQAFGRVDRGRGAEVWVDARGQAFLLAISLPLREVPRAAIDAIEREARNDQRLKGFRPNEARKLRLSAIDKDQYQFFGDDADGEPLDVRVDDKGEVVTSGDTGLIRREESGISSPEARPREAVAAKGFAVLAARYGIDHHWIDVTETVRSAVADGHKSFKSDGLPDPVFGRHKSIVLLYSFDGKVGLSTARDDEELPLDARQEPSTLAPIPARGFAVLAAQFGHEEKWEDVTTAVRTLVANDRLDFKPAQVKLPDPAPDQPKALAIAYAIDGRVGLYVQSQWRSPNLPPDAPPVNSDSLLARSIEFPQKPSLVAFTPDGRQVVVGVEDGSVRVLDAATGREVHRFDGHSPGWLTVAVSNNGSLIVSGGADKVIRVWDVKSEREKAILRGHTEPLQRVAISPVSRTIASSAWDKTVRLWDVATGRELRKFEGHTDVVGGLKFTPDGRQLVTASWDKTARVWDVATGREVHKLSTSGDTLFDVALSKTGRDVFFGSRDGFLRWWEPSSSRDPLSFSVDTECDWAIASLPDGHRVLFNDKIAAVVWDCKTTHPVLRLEKHVNRVTGLAVSPDGRRAATCGEDKALKLWNLPDLGR